MGSNFLLRGQSQREEELQLLLDHRTFRLAPGPPNPHPPCVSDPCLSGGKAGLGGPVHPGGAERLGLGPSEEEDEEDGQRPVRLRPVRQDLPEEQLAAAPQVRAHR